MRRSVTMQSTDIVACDPPDSTRQNSETDALELLRSLEVCMPPVDDFLSGKTPVEWRDRSERETAFLSRVLPALRDANAPDAVWEAVSTLAQGPLIVSPGHLGRPGAQEFLRKLNLSRGVIRGFLDAARNDGGTGFVSSSAEHIIGSAGDSLSDQALSVDASAPPDEGRPSNQDQPAHREASQLRAQLHAERAAHDRALTELRTEAARRERDLQSQVSTLRNALTEAERTHAAEIRRLTADRSDTATPAKSHGAKPAGNIPTAAAKKSRTKSASEESPTPAKRRLSVPTRPSPNRKTIRDSRPEPTADGVRHNPSQELDLLTSQLDEMRTWLEPKVPCITRFTKSLHEAVAQGRFKPPTTETGARVLILAHFKQNTETRSTGQRTSAQQL